ncbi:MAG: HAD family hydrolase [Granulosicoccus sp.]
MRAALFDLDETLLDRSGSLRDFVTWQAEGMLRSSVSNTTLFIDRFISLDQKGAVWKDRVYQSLIDEFGITGWTVDELVKSYVQTFCAFCKPRTGAVAAINEFRKQGFRIGLVSNGKTPFQEKNFRALGLSSLFDTIIVSEAVGIRKPEKAIFELACRRVGADINTSVFIGDNPVADIQGASDAGMTTVFVPVESPHQPCEYADYTYDDLSQLIGFVERELSDDMVYL